MVILHIATISNSPFEGVSVVVPKHIDAQIMAGHQVALVNVRNINIEGVAFQFEYSKPFLIDKLPEPFCKPDLVIFQECYNTNYLSISKAIKKQGIKYIIAPHGELSKDAQKKKKIKKTIANKLLFNRFINGAEGIQCLSHLEMDNTSFGRYKFIGTNGVSIPNERKQSFNTTPLFTYIGRLDAFHKGLDILIEAVALIKSELINKGIRIRIFGPDYKGRYKYLQSLIEEADVGNIIDLRHEISGEEKKAVLMETDVFIQTSRFEGMPLGILEALSYGIPCLVTRGTTLGSVIEECNAGWMAETNAESVAQVIMYAINDSANYNNMSENAIRCVQSLFTWKNVEQKALEEYKQLIAY